MGEEIDTTKTISINEQPASHGKFISFEENLKIAEQLIEKYDLKMQKNLNKDVDGWGNVGGYQRSMQHYFRKIPENILENYYGHGITKGNEKEKLAAVLSIFTNKSIKGTASSFSSQQSPYINADFVVISEKGKEIQVREKKIGKDYSEPIFNDDHSWQAKNIGAIVMDVKYYPLLEELKKMFPDVNIIKANQLPEYFGIKEGT